jgi:O-antigen/teichoic acid export membrane protein
MMGPGPTPSSVPGEPNGTGTSSRSPPGQDGSAGAQLRGGAALTYVTTIANFLLNLLFTPLLLRSLGPAAYGLYSLLTALVAYVAVLDFGLGNATIKYIAKFRAERDARAERGFVALSLRIYAGIAALTIVIGGVVLLNLRPLFGTTMSAAELSDARGMCALMILNLALAFPLGTFQAVITGHERFIFLRVVNLGRLLVRTAVLVVLLLLGYKAFAIVLVDTLMTALVGAINIVYVRTRLGVRPQSCHFDRRFIREVAAYSSLVFINIVVDALYWRVGHLVLGATVGTSAVAIFAVAMLLANNYQGVPLALSSVFLPRVTAMVVSGSSPDELLHLFTRTARLQLILAGYVVCGFALFGREFVNLWAGQEYDGAWLVALIVIVPLTVPLIQSVGVHIVQAKNMHGFRAFMSLGIALLNVALSFVLAKRWGATGAALATAATLVAGNILAMNWYYHRRVGLDVLRFFRSVASGLAPAMAIATALGALTLVVPGYSWPTLALRGAAFTTAYAAAMWRFGMNAYEKELVLGVIRWAGRTRPAVAPH